MIKQSLAFDGILEKKFKILRTSIMLGNLKDRDKVLREYEDTAREVDNIKKSVYEELLASKMYTTVTLEEEVTRLKELISFIENRVKERNDFVDDYIKITSNFLDGLDKVSLENELDNYKIRYNNIYQYLNNCEEIKNLNTKLKELHNELEEKYDNKANNELINSKLEEELLDYFNNLISRDEYYSQLNYTDIDLEITKLEESLLEKKGVLDTFTSSYDALVNAGISGAEREEYSSYVNDAKLNYYEDLEKKYILNIYKLVLDKQVDYDKLYEKRNAINDILNDRNDNRESLNIYERDCLEHFVNLAKEQFSIIKSQKFNMEIIDKLIYEITDCENRLTQLEDDNKKDEVVELLKEFSVDALEIEKIELPDESTLIKETLSDDSEKPANLVIKVREPIKLNVKNASDTAKLVMKKVVIVLEPKKFNTKKDKLKEAENKAIEEDMSLEKVDDIFEDNRDINEDIFVDVSTESTLDDNSNDNNSTIINIEDSNDVMSVPAEIFIEEPPKDDEVDLFNSTDPFLDDNEFEINNNHTEEVISNMPEIRNIGTVKPNKALAEIEKKVNETDDILLPNLGLVDNKQEVPIVGENYIN